MCVNSVVSSCPLSDPLFPYSRALPAVSLIFSFTLSGINSTFSPNPANHNKHKKENISLMENDVRKDRTGEEDERLGLKVRTAQ